MSKNITLLGASYSAVPAITLPQTGGGTATFYDADGSQTVTSNGTYDVTSLSEMVVNVSGGGGTSAWTKVIDTSYTVSTTSTTAALVATWQTGHSEIWTNDKFVYVRVRDIEGSRAGYFYGSDSFFLKAEHITSTSYTTAIRFTKHHNTDNKTQATVHTGTSGYGIYADTIYSDGRIRIRQRYGSNYGTIDSTYKVEVYLLDPADGILPFA